MPLIKEPLNIDFFVEPKELTDNERRLISEYIKADKLKRQKQESRKKDSIVQSQDKPKRGVPAL